MGTLRLNRRRSPFTMNRGRLCLFFGFFGFLGVLLVATNVNVMQKAIKNDPVGFSKLLAGNQVLNDNDSKSASYVRYNATSTILPVDASFRKPVQINRNHKLKSLNCEKHGGPSQTIAAEMVYWRDILEDTQFISPYINSGSSPKYLTFEPDEGGWNNIRMAMETAIAFAYATGRVLVLPPTQKLYKNGDDNDRDNQFSPHDFFDFDFIAAKHKGFQITTMNEFLNSEIMSRYLETNERTGDKRLPPGYRKDGGGLVVDQEFWMWIRNVTTKVHWDSNECVIGFPKRPGANGMKNMTKYKKQVNKQSSYQKYNDNPTPVNASPKARLREITSDRRRLCIYKMVAQNARVIHFMGDKASKGRLLTHFYNVLFFEDWHQDLLTKRFVRDYLRYRDEIQCAAARVVNALRKKSKEHGDPNGSFDSFHIRRRDFLYVYKDAKVDALQIYRRFKSTLKVNSTIFIATDEKDLSFFDPLSKHYHVYFLRDFQYLVEAFSKKHMGMIDQIIASRGRAFAGTYLSTFSGYINRLRGYHSQNEKMSGFKTGELANSYYIAPKRQKLAMHQYQSPRAPYWAREFPVGWRDIDHDIDSVKK